MEWMGYQYEMWEEEGDDRGNGKGWYFVFVGMPNAVIEGPLDSEGQASEVLQARIDEMKHEEKYKDIKNRS